MTLSLAGQARAGDLVLDVALDVEAGETVAVLGPNGAGKTTLLRVLCGLLPLDAGEVALDGQVLDAPADGLFVETETRSIGVVFQDLLLFDTLDVADNVGFGLRALGLRRQAARAQALAWLERVGLAERAGSAVRDLSGGEAQRVALARALAPRPRALLLDEPLAALDAERRATVRRQLRAHLTDHAGPCVLVTHDPLDAAVLADRVVVLEAGRITNAGSLADLVANPRTAWAAELAGTNLLRGRARGSTLTLDAAGAITTAGAPGDGPVLVAIHPSAVSLYRRRPEGSPRNVWQGTISSVEGFGDRRRVTVEGRISVVAEVTAASAEEMALAVGVEVWASVKATEVVAYPA